MSEYQIQQATESDAAETARCARRDTDQDPATPYLSWCLVVRNSASKRMRDGHTFERTLQLLRERTPEAEIVVVDTCSSDDTVEIAKRYADLVEVYRGPHGDDWDANSPNGATNMAAARQHALELASGRWRGWIDDDDALPGPERTRELLEKNHIVAPADADETRGDPDAEPVALEDLLREIEEEFPQADVIWCPYLYQRNEHDCAIMLQQRERFIRWPADPKAPPPYQWSEAAHELLVPTDPSRPVKRVDISGLLFVHEKDWSEGAGEEAARRHFEVLLGEEPTPRRLQYLAAYAPLFAPEREEEFLRDAARLSVAPGDRYRTLVLYGQSYARRGLYLDAREAFGAAISVMPRLPDAYFALAEMEADRKHHVESTRNLREGLLCPRGQTASDVSVWRHEILYASLMAVELERLAATQAEGGAHEEALQSLDEAAGWAERVLGSPGASDDYAEASMRARRLRNAANAQRQALVLHGLWRYLRDNDEPIRAAELLEQVPHNLEDHPLLVQMDLENRKLAHHMDEGYEAAYQTDFFGQEETPQAEYDEPTSPINLRVAEALRLIGKESERLGRPVRVLDFGSFDGIMAIPILDRGSQWIASYLAVDVDHRARGRLAAEAERRGHASKLETSPEVFGAGSSEAYDVVLACEILEHVPDPEEELDRIAGSCQAEAALLVTTPLGAFDYGHPPEGRTNLGHLRAYTPQRLYDDLLAGGFRPLELWSECADGMEGLFAIARAGHAVDDSVAFVAPAALWDWNGRTVRTEGMGYSESAIVFLAEKVVQEVGGADAAKVFGPVPSETVHRGVPYWRREKLRHLCHEPEARIVVSRAPGFCREIDRRTWPVQHAKVLWLQDTHYPELSEDPSLQEEYEAIICVSGWHRGFLLEQHPELEPARVRVIENWLPPGLYDRPPGEWPQKEPGYFVYASSPDRGLIRLLELWPRIRQIVPDAQLDIFYGWRGCQALAGAHSPLWLQRFHRVRADYDRLRHQPGVREVGMRPQHEIAEALYRSAVWAYPTDFCETFGTIAAQARAAGAVPVTTALAGLNESAGCPQARLIDPEADDYEERFLDALQEVIDLPERARREMAAEAQRQFGLEAIWPKWREVLLG